MSSSAHSTSCGENVSIRPNSSANGSLSCGAMGRISMTSLERELHEPGCQLGIAYPCRGRGLRESCFRVEIAVGVDVDDERLTRGREPEIDAPVVAAVERIEGGQRAV